MNRRHPDTIEQAKQAALAILHRNWHGPHRGLPRTAGWGYPEPYTRDLMLSALGVLVSEDKRLIVGLRRTLEALAGNQSELGHISSLAHDPYDRGASDTTPLFLFGLGLYRRAVDEPDFLTGAAERALLWMRYQSPDDAVMVAQQPTTDWRDEQWVPGYGLYVNTIVYAYLRLFDRHDEADRLRQMMNRFDVRGERRQRRVHEGLVVPRKPYYAMWAFKMDNNERFDLLGNSLAILTGIATPSRAHDITWWVEMECRALQVKGELALSLPPCLLPYIRPGDFDWRPRYERFNKPGEYHNGGVWPFICGLYVAALVAVGRLRLAEQKLVYLAELIKPSRDHDVDYGFNEWFRAQDGSPCGQDWQTWSAAMYLYAAAAVERRKTPCFEDIREASSAAL
jgi:hypothetical protein